MEIFTKTGDKGTTGTASGQRVSKAAPVIEMSGAFDEAITRIGAAVVKGDRVLAGGWADPEGSVEAAIHETLIWLQHRLFTAAACATSPHATESPITATDAEIAERLIRSFEVGLEPFKEFTLPGSSEFVIRLHLARTAVRAAERALTVVADGGEDVSPDVRIFVNRVSDLLYVMARAAAAAFKKVPLAWDPNPAAPAGFQPSED